MQRSPSVLLVFSTIFLFSKKQKYIKRTKRQARKLTTQTTPLIFAVNFFLNAI
jgi:hypothetical protein